MRFCSKTNRRVYENLPLRRDYRENNPWCELSPLLKLGRHVPMAHIHHICGGRLGRWDLLTNLLSVSAEAHDWAEKHKTDGRILALYVKMQKGELDQQEFHKVTGLYLEGWLDVHQPTLEIAIGPHVALTSYSEGSL